MKRYLLLILIFSSFVGAGASAQSLGNLFQPLTWEQASLVAAREDKLVLVEVGDVAEVTEQALRGLREVAEELGRGVVAIRMDMQTPQGKAFEPRLLHAPYPCFAFFMPYGDLVGVVAAEAVRKEPALLKEALAEAEKKADIKRRNSRSVRFSAGSLAEAVAVAQASGKHVFVFVADDSRQASLLMERDVFTLDRVADVFNRDFVNVRMVVGEEGIDNYGIAGEDAPVCLFLNAAGKCLYRATGFQDADALLACAGQALEKAKGIPFCVLTEEEAQLQATREGKFIFMDCYTDNRVHQELAERVFTDPDVTDFFTAHFVSLAREGEATGLVFTDASGKEVHRLRSVADAADLLREARKVVDGNGLESMKNRFRQGERGDEFVVVYLTALARAGEEEEASQALMAYLEPLAPECLNEGRYWELFAQYGKTASSVLLDYLLLHREELGGRYGEAAVWDKIATLWIAGASVFVRDGQFDEEGFKAYAKRLRREKVEGWRSIARNARMQLAEQTEDWKTFIALAAEKWTEEEVTDAELYRWALEINARCTDGNVRYKMAQQLASRVAAINRKERLTGKADLTSYRGFFEKVIDDLLKGL